MHFLLWSLVFSNVSFSSDVVTPKLGSHVRLDGYQVSNAKKLRVTRSIKIVDYDKRKKEYTVEDVLLFEDGSSIDNSYKQSKSVLEKSMRDTAATVVLCLQIGGQEEYIRTTAGDFETCHFTRNPEDGLSEIWFSNQTPFGTVRSYHHNERTDKILSLEVTSYAW